MVKLFSVVYALTCLSPMSQDPIPFKPNEDFEAKIDLSFKQREADGINTFRFEESGKKRTMDRPIAFLAINFKVLKAEGESKMRILRSGKEKTSKIKLAATVKIEVGFIEDLKSEGEVTSIVLHFLDEERKEKSQVVFMIQEDGTFLVNGEKRGKF